MSTAPPSTAWLELNQFCSEHHRATLILLTAAHDYAAARCLLLNNLFGGLVFGAQTIEKLLKAYLLFGDPARNVKAFGHSLPKLLGQADALFPQVQLSRYAPTAQKFGSHYASRYPDDPGGSKSMSTGDLIELDEFVVLLNENLPCPRNVRYRTGLYANITFSLGLGGTVSPWENWIKNRNQALSPLIPRINADHAAVLAELYPGEEV
jgi:hypothetical protein